jgi:hypothetical protein
MISLAMPNCRRAFHGDGAHKSLFLVRFSFFVVQRYASCGERDGVD